MFEEKWLSQEIKINVQKYIELSEYREELSTSVEKGIALANIAGWTLSSQDRHH